MTTPRRRNNRQSRHLNYEALESRNLLAVALFQNPIDAWDVNGDGTRSPLDPLIVINYLNENGVSGIDLEQGALPDHYVDVNGDGFATAVDALMGINTLTAASQQPMAEPEEAGEVPDFVTDAILQATANAEHAPAGNIFEIASHTYREIAQSSLAVHQAINNQIVQTYTDDGPLLRELRERFNTEYRHATQRFIEQRDVTQFVQDIQQLNSETQHITREIISDNSQQIIDLANVRRDVLRNQVDHIAQVAQSVRQNVVQNIRHGLPPHHAQSTVQSSIHAALDATSAAIQEFEQRLVEGNADRSQRIAEISSRISSLGSHALSGVNIGTFSGNFSVSHPTCAGQTISGNITWKNVHFDADQNTLQSAEVEVTGQQIYNPETCTVVGVQNSISGSTSGILLGELFAGSGQFRARGNIQVTFRNPNTQAPVATSFDWETSVDPQVIRRDASGAITLIGAIIKVGGVERGSFALTPQPDGN